MKNEAAVPTAEITKQDAFLQQQQAGASDGRKASHRAAQEAQSPE